MGEYAPLGRVREGAKCLGLDIIRVVLSSWERERVLSGAHAASGGHVSTWVHAVIAGKFKSLGVPPHHSCDPRLLTSLASYPIHPLTHVLSHHLHRRPLNKHAPWETTVIFELSCVFPVKYNTPILCLNLCCVLMVYCCSPRSFLTKHGLLPSSVLYQALLLPSPYLN
jgi:hypothetical protein